MWKADPSYCSKNCEGFYYDRGSYLPLSRRVSIKKQFTKLLKSVAQSCRVIPDQITVVTDTSTSNT